MHCRSYSHFFSKKFQHICISLDVNFNESLTNDIVSFKQLGPALSCLKFFNSQCYISSQKHVVKRHFKEYLQYMFLRRNKKISMLFVLITIALSSAMICDSQKQWSDRLHVQDGSCSTLLICRKVLTAVSHIQTNV